MIVVVTVVVVAIYLMPLLWHAHETIMPPDLAPSDSQVARRVLQSSCCGSGMDAQAAKEMSERERMLSVI